MNEGAINFFAGTVAGVSCTLVEHPFDTVKVLLQADHRNNYQHSSLRCTQEVLRSQGIHGLYAGLTARLCISGFEHAMMFAVYGWTLGLLGADVNHPSVKDVLFSGAATGVCSGLCLTPFELIKCRMQVAVETSLPVTNLSNQKSLTMRRVAYDILRNEGWTGLFRGGTATMMREIPGTTAWLGGYEFMKNFFFSWNRRTLEECNNDKDFSESNFKLSIWQTIFSGGVSGVLFWTVFFPADVVKTRVQVELKGKRKNSGADIRPSFFNTMRQLYLEGGIRTLYSGWSLTVIRSFPSNAVLFLTYEAVRNSLKSSFQINEVKSNSGDKAHDSGNLSLPSFNGTSGTVSGMMCQH